MQSIKEKAFSLLAKRAYFSKQLKEKLRIKGYPEEDITSLLQELKKRGWLNDEELAKRFVENQRQKGYGARFIAMKLREKAGVIDISISESEEAVLHLVKKRYLSKLPEKRHLVVSALLRRGISYELINKVLSRISKDDG